MGACTKLGVKYSMDTGLYPTTNISLTCVHIACLGQGSKDTIITTYLWLSIRGTQDFFVVGRWSPPLVVWAATYC